MTPERLHDLAARTRADYDAATSAAVQASLNLEAAYMSGDAALKAEANRTWQSAYAAEVKARAAWLAAMQEFRPSFESLLADPTLQFDKDGEVLASILAYQDATLATACGCLGAMHKGCAP